MVNGAVSDADLKPKVRSLALSTPIKLSVWPDSPYINDALKPYNVQIPIVSDARVFAFQQGASAQYPERFEKFRKAYQAAMKNPESVAVMAKMGATDEAGYRGPEESQR